MALDTANKRSSAVHVGSPWRNQFPIADGTIDVNDRAQSANYYSGLTIAIAGSGGSSGSPARNVYLPPNYWQPDLEHVAGQKDPDAPTIKRYYGRGTLPAIAGKGRCRLVWKSHRLTHVGNGQLARIVGQFAASAYWIPFVYHHVAVGGKLVTQSRTYKQIVGTGQGPSRKRIKREYLDLIDPELAKLLGR